MNYVDDANWGQTVKDITKVGVDHVIEVGGAATLQQSVNAIKFEGVLSVIGAVGKGEARIPTLLDAWINSFIARGVSVGSRDMMEDMVAAVEAANIRPLLDEKTFALQDAREAFRYFVSHIPVSAILAD